jgi:hypothetical protein
MGTINYNRVKQLATGSGTGNLTLSGSAEPTFRTIQDTYGTDVYVTALITQGADWEIYTGWVSGTTFTRASDDEVVDSSNAGARVSWPSGDKTVSVIAVALDADVADDPNTLNLGAVHGFQPGDIVTSPSAQYGRRAWMFVGAPGDSGWWAPLPSLSYEGLDLSLNDTNKANNWGSNFGGSHNRVDYGSTTFGIGAVGVAEGNVASGGGLIDLGSNVEARGTTNNVGWLVETTNDTPKIMRFNNESGGAPFPLVNNAVARLTIRIVAVCPADDDAKSWTIECMAGTLGSVLQIIGSPVIADDFATAGASAWDVDVAVASGGVHAVVTGASGKTIYWAAQCIGPSVAVTTAYHASVW